jgi:regulator of nucleoside diphosphate kinase
MAERRIYITKNDAKKLEELLKAGLRHNGNRDLDNLRVLKEELRRARIVGASEVTPDVVTMHSCVRVKDPYDDEAMDITLVFPDEAEPDGGRISVVAPIGAAILGYKAGDTVQFRTPGGLRRLQVEQVLYQPEAAGQVCA